MDNNQEEEGTNLPPPPVTTFQDLQEGIFSIIMTMIQTLLAQGRSKEEAQEEVAQVLEAFATVLHANTEEQKA